jgi:DNA-binding winged helix-turn-helix (wHTH) protein
MLMADCRRAPKRDTSGGDLVRAKARNAKGSGSEAVAARLPLVFSCFHLDRSNERLRRGDEIIRLPPKAFALLCYLAEHPQQLIAKSELLRALWGDVHVNNAVLKTHLNQLRRAMKDDVRVPHLIETIPRRGYRFIARVSVAAADDERNEPTNAPCKAILTGRERELTLLKASLNGCSNGSRRLVFLSGEAGIGKTSLVNTFLRDIENGPHLWTARGACVEYCGGAEASLPILEALGRLCRGPQGPQVKELLRRWAPSWVPELPELSAAPRNPSLVPSSMSPRMLIEMAAAVRMMTRRAPVVLVLEDLQWADHLTLNLIDYLARDDDPARLLIVGTYRPQEVLQPTHPLRAIKQRLDADGRCGEIAIAPLAEREVLAYLNARFGKHHFPPELARALELHTAGNALFMVRVIDDLVNQAVLRLSNGQWHLVGDLDAVAASVPEGVVALIERDLDQLDELERRILEVASAAGHEFCSLAIADAAERDPLSVEELFMQWNAQARFIKAERIVDGSADAAVALRCFFLHALYQRVLCARIGPACQAELRRRIAASDSERRARRESRQ